MIDPGMGRRGHSRLGSVSDAQPGFAESMRHILCLQDPEIRRRNLITDAELAAVPHGALVVWTSNDPSGPAAAGMDMAAKLRGVHLYLASGTGAPDPNNPSSFSNPGGAATEAGIYQMNQGFLSALRQVGITPTEVNFYPFGVHDWPYWRADLAQFLGLLSTDGFTR